MSGGRWRESNRCGAWIFAVLWLAAGSVGLQCQAPARASAAPANAEAASPAAKVLAYDVVTIRPNNQGPGSVRVSTDINVFLGTNVSLLNLLQEAYNLQPELIAGGPKWVDSARFDIHAKNVDASPEELKKLTRDDHRLQIRALLADRFHLVAHTEVKMLPVYELTVAKGGLKLTEVASEHRNDAFHGVSSGGTSTHNGNLVAHYQSMAGFADTMSSQVHHVVLDRTGMPGKYNFQLTWTRDDVPAVDDASAPPLFTALEEQLGLKLVSAKGPVTTLVIDHADLPSADEN